MSISSSTSMTRKFKFLSTFSACDISDALLKLDVPGAGFLADLVPYAPHHPDSSSLRLQQKSIGPASTVLFSPKDTNTTDSTTHPAFNIPAGTHYVDGTRSDTIMVLSQPPSQTCAVLGGIMALRMKVCGAQAVVVDGRVRDLRELRALDFPIWAKGTSTVGTAMQAKPWAVDVPVTIQGIQVYPGDIIFADPIEGVVAIPQGRLDAVLELLPLLTEADEKVRVFVRDGGEVREGFKRYRG